MRWTNLYFPARFIFWGDLIAGKTAPNLGPGIRDVAVRTGQRFGLFTHTLYWTRGKSGRTEEHIGELR